MEPNQNRRISLEEAKRRAKARKQQQQQHQVNDNVVDFYKKSMDSTIIVKGKTGIIYDEEMAKHQNLWDDKHPECPERFTQVLKRCKELQLIERCHRIASRKCTLEDILLKHTMEHYEKLKATSGSNDAIALENTCSAFDAIFIHPTTFEISLLGVGCTIELVDQILLKNVQNGMAIIRPPGHHAMKAEYNGYCFFNNVAIAAQHALDKRGVKKILIVDWDVHHGQATQQMFYDDPRVLYFSIHRYEYGTFWPNLRESNFDYVGELRGAGYNFNVPLNKIGMTNSDYLAIFQQILLPVANEFQPELVIVSSGYDAAYGCTEGEMEVTPAFYSHLLSPLLSLAEGKIAVILEGGYCLQSLAEGAALTLKTLIGDPCPALIEKMVPPSSSIQESILNCISVHKKYWKCFQINQTYDLTELSNIADDAAAQQLHKVDNVYKWTEPKPTVYPTRFSYATHTEEQKAEISKYLTNLQEITSLTVPEFRVAYVYDHKMTEHRNLNEEHVENPERIEQIWEQFKKFSLIDRMKKIESRAATYDELYRIHTDKHINLINKMSSRTNEDATDKMFNSVYFHPQSYACASLAAGSVLQVVDSVLKGESRSGVCIVRPPGHHAEADKPLGFCLFNNVAVAAKYAAKTYNLKRILILDWDIHHGNGTQNCFKSNPNVLYISVHRYDQGNFFPGSKDADFTVVGDASGRGFNVNIPWNKKGMGDQEYSLVFHKIILPIAYEYNPELVLVSAGFDAAVGDPIGGCQVTPEAFGHFTHWLTSLANGRIILCLEGGYNLNSVSYAMTLCTKALLGDPLPMLDAAAGQKVNPSCFDTIRNVLSVHEKYWKSLIFHKKLPNFDQHEISSLKSIADTLEKLNIDDSTSKS